MNETPTPHPALLPAGLGDVLPPDAELEARLVESIMDCFAAYGYERVKPPLLEFEDSLFAGPGVATMDQTFRLMDPDSQRMMGLRADTTPQIGRLATTRLAGAPRPLRLAYAGQCLRVRGSHLQPERQFAQAGVELIGSDTPGADAEIILTAVAALSAIGLSEVSVDLTVPQLVAHLLGAAKEENRAALARALDRKDAAAVSALDDPAAATALELLEACGPVDKTIAALLAIGLSREPRQQAERLAETAAAIRKHRPDLQLTADPVEFRGYRYHTGLCMTLLAPGNQSELGRGGRYVCGDLEPATGITLYPDMIARVAPRARLRQRIYVPFGTPGAVAAACREKNFATILALSPHPAPEAEAARLGCSHLFRDGDIVALS
jgi:ATP phosphoribosyltransferase regulatory subunit